MALPARDGLNTGAVTGRVAIATLMGAGAGIAVLLFVARLFGFLMAFGGTISGADEATMWTIVRAVAATCGLFAIVVVQVGTLPKALRGEQSTRRLMWMERAAVVIALVFFPPALVGAYTAWQRWSLVDEARSGPGGHLAIATLGREHSNRGCRTLTDIAGDARVPPHTRAVAAARRCPAGLELALGFAHDQRPILRVAAVATVRLSEAPRACAAYVILARDDDAAVRTAAGFGWDPDPSDGFAPPASSDQILTHQLRWGSPADRLSAAAALHTDVGPTWTLVLDRAQPEAVRLRGIEVLGLIGHADAIPLLESAIGHCDQTWFISTASAPACRETAARALETLQQARAVAVREP